MELIDEMQNILAGPFHESHADMSVLGNFISMASQASEAGDNLRKELFKLARQVAQEHFGKRIYIRGLIEFTSFCTQNCFYCGLRSSNKKAERYRLTENEIFNCCAQGYALGFRSFVLQGGEDPWFTDEHLLDLIRQIKIRWADCAFTLSIGEKKRDSYASYRSAGVDRYLLRHETATAQHFARLHPSSQTLDSRLQCLCDLRDLGFQAGAGFMVGSPAQSAEHLVNDLCFLKQLQPQMVGIGPFIPHKDTPFAAESAGSLEQTLVMLSMTRILLPNSLLPSTTALGSIKENGRELGILAGANVLMPNLSPPEQREKYNLYNGKLYSHEEAAENLADLKKRIAAIGYEIVTDRGDYADAEWNDGRNVI